MSYVELITDCWSRGFNHESYLNYAKRVGDHTKTNPHTVSEDAYKLICQGLDLDLEDNIVLVSHLDPFNAPFSEEEIAELQAWALSPNQGY